MANSVRKSGYYSEVKLCSPIWFFHSEMQIVINPLTKMFATTDILVE